MVTASFQLSWHWFLTRANSLAQVLRRLYLSHDAHLGKGVAPVFDVFLPSIWLGLLAGVFTWDWPIRKLIGFLVAFSVGLACMLPAYAYLLGSAQLWWWPQTSPETAVMFVGKTTQALLVVTFFAYVGRLWGENHNTRPETNG